MNWRLPVIAALAFGLNACRADDGAASGRSAPISVTMVAFAAATPAVLPSPTSPPMVATTATSTPLPGSARLDCAQGQVYRRCADDYLGIRFDLPAIWGELRTYSQTLDLAEGTGSTYNYLIDQVAVRMAGYPLLFGLGRSRDYALDTGTDQMDYLWLTQHVQDCKSDDYLLKDCVDLKNGVQLISTISAACVSGPGLVSEPMTLVVIPLHNHPRMAQFVLVAALAAPMSTQRIADRIGGIPGEKCTAENKAAYTQQAQTYFRDLRATNAADNADPTERQRFEQVKHFAESVEFIE